MAAVKRIEVLSPRSVRHTAAHEPGDRIEYIAVILRSAHEILIILLLAQLFGHLCDTPVIVGVFQRLGYRLVLQIGWQVTVLLIIPEPSDGVHCAFLHRGKSFFIIKLHPFECSIHDNGDGMVTDHTIRFATFESPHR